MGYEAGRGLTGIDKINPLFSPFIHPNNLTFVNILQPILKCPISKGRERERDRERKRERERWKERNPNRERHIHTYEERKR